MASLQVEASPVEVVSDKVEETTKKSPTCEETLFSPIDHDIVTESKTAEPDMEVEELEEVVAPDEENEEKPPAAKEEKVQAAPTCTSCGCAEATAATGPTHKFAGEEEEEEEEDHED
ncbi:hypothetical protein F0562_002229 [Nyssa sinensis]|uniref:Uncharacterized protein n=1 Tax=Nyssa sinensis TaxID=561372 RepID=A0A5J5C5B3_9ASTE|nr:hypothetical protein F0562_002229 [Nyssa sinensis]